jgi:hypothetical protein
MVAGGAAIFEIPERWDHAPSNLGCRRRDGRTVECGELGDGFVDLPRSNMVRTR